ncbi:MAG TPA: hypothetical protein VN381_03390 [Anaerovoracaceae bacterium]|nr:hypothetical protein [Anaerovoracaceae bacterium]
MKLNVAVLNPAGNITLIVTTPVEKAAYAEIAGKLLNIPELHGEQVGFLAPPRHGGATRLEMMGGEFCGNALRCTGYYHALRAGIRGAAVVSTEISGSDKPLDVRVDTDHNAAKAEMTLPLSINNITVNGRTAKAVAFEGIVHFIADMPGSDSLSGIDEAFVKAAVDYAVGKLGAEAAGIMFFDRASMFIRPVVYVHETGSLVYENSCASGSAATAVTCAYGLQDGEYRFDVCQPGGVIEVELSKRSGHFEKLAIGGRVSVNEERIVELWD